MYIYIYIYDIYIYVCSTFFIHKIDTNIYKQLLIDVWSLSHSVGVLSFDESCWSHWNL